MVLAVVTLVLADGVGKMSEDTLPLEIPMATVTSMRMMADAIS